MPRNRVCFADCPLHSQNHQNINLLHNMIKWAMPVQLYLSLFSIGRYR